MSADTTVTLDALAQELRLRGWQHYPDNGDTPINAPDTPFLHIFPPNSGHEEEGRIMALYQLEVPDGMLARDWADFLLVIREDPVDQRVLGLTVEDINGGATWGIRGWDGLDVAFKWAETVIKKALRYWDEEMYLDDDGSSTVFDFLS